MTAVRARFYVSEVKRQAYDADSTFVTMQAVTRGEHNKNWSRYTPSGSMTMQIKSPLAAQIFADRLGQEFDLAVHASRGRQRVPRPVRPGYAA